MTKTSKTTNQIDAVITWVDGNDEQHHQKMLPFVADKSSVSNKKFRTRFDQVNEIKFTIDSILKFAPYIQKIYVVTDRQTPDFLMEPSETYKMVSMVDHTEIFREYNEYLPVFNCRPIETLLYRIPNLSDHFIYFNDDMMLMNPTKPEDFFQDGLPVLRGSWKRFDEHRILKRIKEKIKKKKQVGHKLAQQKGAKLIGFKKYFKFEHTPYPMRKSTFESYFKDATEVQVENIRYKFRDINQFTPQGLVNHIEIKNKTCIIQEDIQLVYIGSYKKPIQWYQRKLNKFKSDPNLLFLNVQSLDQCPKNKLDVILDMLVERLR